MQKNLKYSGESKDLTKAVTDLQKTIVQVSKDSAYIISPGKNLFMSYLRGVVYGLGVLTAVAIVIPLILSMLQRVEWVPVVGDFVEKIVTRVENAQVR